MGIIMYTNEIGKFVEQIRSILLGKKIKDDMISTTPEFKMLQDAFIYLEGNLTETFGFLHQIAKGNLDVEAPQRHNFLSGDIKDLRASLKHLAWQAQQVAAGDYTQKVDFLGDFSSAFNSMTLQLLERETELRERSLFLMDSLELLQSIMDGLSDWIIVLSADTREILYINETAKVALNECECRTSFETLLNSLKEITPSTVGQNTMDGDLLTQLSQKDEEKEQYVEKDSYYEFHCDAVDKSLQVKSFITNWYDKVAYVHYIKDVTYEKAYQVKMEKLAYKDGLTGLYNRRYCMDTVDKFLSEHQSFQFCMIDLDGLKFANDNFGHKAGDHYLQNLVKAMKTYFAPMDLLIRYGGDEFAAISLDKTEAEMIKTMNLVNAMLQSIEIDFPMSASFGTVYVSEEERLPFGQIIKIADGKMYDYKRLHKKERKLV